MIEQFDTSSIPDDPAYWDAATARVAEAVRRRRQSTSAWLCAGRGAWVAAGLTAASVSLVVALSARNARREREGTAAWTLMLVPNDRLGRAFAYAEAPPTLTELRLGVPDSLINVK